MSSELDTLEAEIPPEMDGRRLDQALAELFSQYSRSRLQSWVKSGHVRVDDKQLRPKDRVNTGQWVTLDVPEEQQTEAGAEAIELEIVYEDEELTVINKPAGMVVHPAAGNPSGTLLNALLHHDEKLANLPRGGIVHRIDKDTTGLLVVARTLTAHKSLVEQLQARSVSREYLAVTQGVMTAGGTVDEPIGRHPVNRKKMTVVKHGGKEAITHYRIEQRFRAHTAISVKLETGRTHQIRVHMSHIRYPLVGDQVYGGRFRVPPDCNEELHTTLQNFKRQALHARSLSLIHPASGETMQWHAPVPDDMLHLLAALASDVEQHKG